MIYFTLFSYDYNANNQLLSLLFASYHSKKTAYEFINEMIFDCVLLNCLPILYFEALWTLPSTFIILNFEPSHVLICSIKILLSFICLASCGVCANNRRSRVIRVTQGQKRLRKHCSKPFYLWFCFSRMQKFFKMWYRPGAFGKNEIHWI